MVAFMRPISAANCLMFPRSKRRGKFPVAATTSSAPSFGVISFFVIFAIFFDFEAGAAVVTLKNLLLRVPPLVVAEVRLSRSPEIALATLEGETTGTHGGVFVFHQVNVEQKLDRKTFVA